MGEAIGRVNSRRNEAKEKQKEVSTVVCLSLTPDDHSLFYNFNNSFLSDVSE